MYSRFKLIIKLQPLYNVYSEDALGGMFFSHLILNLSLIGFKNVWSVLSKIFNLEGILFDVYLLIMVCNSWKPIESLHSLLIVLGRVKISFIAGFRI